MRPNRIRHLRSILLALSAGFVLTAPILAEPAVAHVSDSAPVIDERSHYPDEWTEMSLDLANAHELSMAEALDRLIAHEARLLLREELAMSLGSSFAGFRMDWSTGTQHVLVTDPASGSIVLDVGLRRNVAVQSEVVTYSYETLETLAERIASGSDPVIGTDIKGAYVDDNTNSVSVYVHPSRIGTLRMRQAEMHPAVRVYTALPDAEPEACNHKDGCGSPLRGGISIWFENVANIECSLGYTATTSDGTPWAISAGHCAEDNGGLDVLWGHGEQQFGPVRAFENEGDVDVMRVRIDSSYWRQGLPGGWLTRLIPGGGMNIGDSPVPLDHVAVVRSVIDFGDPVCLSARWPRWGDSCGTISNEFGTRGMVRVGDYDACPGDSGGAWHFRNASGAYMAFGVHHGGRLGCPQRDDDGLNSSQGWSMFSAMPDIYGFWQDEDLDILIDTQ